MLGDRSAGLRTRRTIVKTRLVRLGGKGLGAARAHLRYIQRDGVSRDGDPGRLYSAAGDQADGNAFLERCDGDRHQFRFIVSAEDGDQYEDLKPLIRRFMARMEEDLGTRLDWVAVDHVDTLHPHTHIMLRGRDERGENLVIAPDYIKTGMRERLAGLVSLDLGPRTDLEIEQRLRHEVHAERLTGIDRQLLRELTGRLAWRRPLPARWPNMRFAAAGCASSPRSGLPKSWAADAGASRAISSRRSGSWANGATLSEPCSAP